jgi:4-hydroxy-2-oxoheptanedioate aldolase
MKTEDPMFVEIVGLTGFDFVILDMEHGPVTIQQQQNNIRAAISRDLLPIIRSKDINENTIGSILDIGSCGIQVPQVKTAAQARQVVEYSKYYPYGMRGVCRFVRAADYSTMERNTFFENSKDIIIIIQLEGKEAISNLDEILSIDGIDILFIGPYDLSQSLGVPGQIDHPIVIEKVNEISKKAQNSGKIVGTFVDTIQNAVKWKKAGIQYLSYNTDAGIFSEACSNILHDIKLL